MLTPRSNPQRSSFSQTRNIGNISINANFLFPYIYSFLLCLPHLMLVNGKSDVSKYKKITFQGCKHYWSSLFLVAQLKRSTEESLWKTLLDYVILQMCSFVSSAHRESTFQGITFHWG